MSGRKAGLVFQFLWMICCDRLTVAAAGITLDGVCMDVDGPSISLMVS